MPLAACDPCDAIYVTDRPAPDCPLCPGCGAPLRPASPGEALPRARNPRPREPVIREPGPSPALAARLQQSAEMAARTRQESRQIRERTRAARLQGGGRKGPPELATSGPEEVT